MSYTLLSLTTPVSKKRRPCIWCGETIHEGERHEHERSVYQGEFQDQRWHPECRAFYLKHAGEYENEFTAYDNPRPDRATTDGGASR